MNPFDLTGRVAIVTGGNGGIGLGMATGLINAGATVVLAGRNAAKGKAAAKELGERASFATADVTQKEACDKLVRATTRKHGRLDIMICNAGIGIRKQPQDYALEEWNAVIATNLTSAFLCCQAAYPAFLKSGGGKIVTIGSVMTLMAAPHTAPYAASKGGIVQFTRALATAWAKDNIQANSILPGWIDTDMTQAARSQVAGLNDNVMTRTPAGRWGVPADLAGLAVFLCAPASDFVTGTAIPCDGGYTIRG